MKTIQAYIDNYAVRDAFSLNDTHRHPQHQTDNERKGKATKLGDTRIAMPHFTMDRTGPRRVKGGQTCVTQVGLHVRDTTKKYRDTQEV